MDFRLGDDDGVSDLDYVYISFEPWRSLEWRGSKGLFRAPEVSPFQSWRFGCDEHGHVGRHHHINLGVEHTQMTSIPILCGLEIVPSVLYDAVHIFMIHIY